MHRPGSSDADPGVITQTRTEKRLAKPRLYKVLLHNDHYTTMDFVVWILQGVFNRNEAEATQIMLNVHRNGIGVAGIYTHEVAETKVARVHELAKEHEFPLKLTIEPEE